MKNIAVICAHPKHNPGMLSVDLSFKSLVKSIGDNVQITFYTVKKPLTLQNEYFCLEYKLLESVKQLELYDKIVIWGDFLLWSNYGLNEFYSRKKIKDVELDAEITEKWYSLLLLENRIDLQKKTIIFGTTVYGLDSRQLSNERYFNALISLCNNSRLILFRDIFSFNYISQLSSNKTNIHIGLDCALFLDTDSIFKSKIGDEYICYAFGRSGFNDEFKKLVDIISEKTNLKTININWLDKSGLDGLAEKIKIIKNASAVITDIYHCSITGVRENRPVICLGIGSSSSDTTLDDKKKEIFFRQHFLSNNYFYAEDVLSSLKNLDDISYKIIDSINDKDSLKFVFSTMSNQIERVKTLLINELLS